MEGSSSTDSYLESQRSSQRKLGRQKEETTQRRQGDTKVSDKASAASATPYEFGGRPQTMEGSSSTDSHQKPQRSAQRKLFEEHIKLTEYTIKKN
jgi:hypothetical protein